MFFKQMMADQAAKPRGILGRFVGRMMAKGNLESNVWVVSLLELREDDHVLELGFGPGTAVQEIEAKVPRGKVAGIDVSEAMVERATALNQEAVSEGRVDLRVGEAKSIPWPEGSFDKALAVNVVYLWPELGSIFKEVRRVLKPGGVFAVYLAPLEMMERLGFTGLDTFTFHTTEDVLEVCEEAGFSKVVTKSSSIGQGTGVCILAVK